MSTVDQDTLAKVVATIRFDSQAQGDSGSRTTTRNWYTNATGSLRSGFWSSEPGKSEVRYTKNEFCSILSGRVRLTDASGHAEIYEAGDGFFIPEGFTGTWETLEPVRKFFVIHDPAK